MDSVITISPTIATRLSSLDRLTLIRLCLTGAPVCAGVPGAAGLAGSAAEEVSTAGTAAAGYEAETVFAAGSGFFEALVATFSITS